MYDIYSIESRKGGVGKTTIALNLAKALAEKDYDVLLIDCDITGTPITEAATHSDFWMGKVVLSKIEGKPCNLIHFFENDYLRKENSVKAVINGIDYQKKKIHVIGSEIYDSDGMLIIDPRHLMDDLHSFWFLKMLRDIADEFCKTTKQQNKAIILDNSPGYVGIGRGVREWMVKRGPENSKFVLVSSLDEQDIDSTVSSACEIMKMMGNSKELSSYVKAIINRVPEDLVDEGNRYEFREQKNEDKNEVQDKLFPLDQRGFPKNIIKYDKDISVQFIEARLRPMQIAEGVNGDLEGAYRSFEKKVMSYEQKPDRYTDIISMDSYYRKWLGELKNAGFIRLSKSLGGNLQPSSMNKKLEDQVALLGNMAHPNAEILNFSKEELKSAGLNQLYHFMEDKDLSEYSPVFLSLFHGIYKTAGFERKGGNIFQMFNLNLLLAAFYAFQREFYHANATNSFGRTGYREFLKSEEIKRRAKKFDDRLFFDNNIIMIGDKVIETDPYIANLLNAYFSRFYQAMCYTILRMIDCQRDYNLLLSVYRDVRKQKTKIMSESLTKYLRNVIAKKSEEPSDKKYNQYVNEPYEMRNVQEILLEYVLK